MAAEKDLPESLITNILSKLPVKSLLKFRCVCKSWHALIRSQYFIESHLRHFSQLTHHSDNVQLLVRRWDYVSGNEVFCVLSPESFEISVSISMRFLNTTWRIQALCNGIFCLCGNGDNMALWNFATKEFKVLPLSQIARPPDTIDTLNDEIGFGFDDDGNEYKVVRVVSNYREDHSYTKQVELYTLSTNSWREIHAVMPHLVTYPTVSNTWLNGAFHWWALEEPKNYMVVSFDMGTEEFKMMPLPDYVVLWTSTEGILTTLDRSLALVVFPREETNPCIDVWVMNEYGVEDSWGKKYCVGPVSGIERPLGFWKDEELFLENHDWQLVRYNIRTNEVEPLKVYGGGRRSIQVASYVDSLVPLKGKRGKVMLLKT